MQGNRDFYVTKKPKLILTKSFRSIVDLEIGQSGQLRISGIVISEKIDDTECIIKTVRVDKVDSINNKGKRSE